MKHWRDKFAVLTSQLDEMEGKPAAVPDPADPPYIVALPPDQDMVALVPRLPREEIR